MVVQSVMAPIERRNQDRHRLALNARQWRRPVHDGPIQRQVRLKHRRIDPMNAQDVVGVQLPLFGGDVFDVGHGPAILANERALVRGFFQGVFDPDSNPEWPDDCRKW